MKSTYLAFLACVFLPCEALATSAPTNLVATAVSSSQINLTWTDNSSSEIGYTFAFDTNSGMTNPTYVFAGGANTTSYSHTGRSAATTYYYTIKAEGNPDSTWTAVTSATTAPSGLAATASSNSALSLTWTGNGGNPDIIGYTYAYASNSSFSGATYHYVAGAGSTSATQTGLATATTYWLKIKAEGTSDVFDSPFGTVVTATTTPASLAATAVSSSQINVSWTGNSGNASLVGYTVAYATNSSFTGATYHFVAGVGATSFNHTGLAAGATYYYKVKAEGTSDPYDSAFTSSASATTPGSGTTLPPGTPISPHFAGMNAWMPAKIGAQNLGGSLAAKMDDVEVSGAKIMRYGGNGVDQYARLSSPETKDQYVALVDDMRLRGIEPVLQVPVYGGAVTSADAAEIVRYVNLVKGRGVKYWSIGNEPDLQSGVYRYTTAAQVASYLMPFASAMKVVDPTIKILGPETAWYNTAIIRGLTVCDGTADDSSTDDKLDITGTDSNGNYYLDVISFHTYPFNGSQLRPEVISKLMEPGGFDTNLAELKTRLAACNSYHGRMGDNALTMAVTEANVNYKQPTQIINGQEVDVDSVGGVGAKSFLGGQLWAELMGIAMQRGVDFVTFWSVIEGNGLSYISSDGNVKRPSYYHFQMMAQSFRGNSVAAADNQPNVKAFGAADVDQIAVMILNQDQASSFNFTVRLDSGAMAVANSLTINVAAGVAAEYSDTIATESSIVLIFNTSGAIKRKIEYKLHGQADANPPTGPTQIAY